MNTKSIATFLASKLSEDLSEGASNILTLTATHHHDEGDENVVSIETTEGQRFMVIVIRA